MPLTHDQAKALSLIYQWLDNGDNWEFRLGGYAGTGKTFLLQYLINSWQGQVLCCAPTGKAASVLASKLDSTVEVSTVHKALYIPTQPVSPELDALIEQGLLDPDNAELQALIDVEKEKFKKKRVSFSTKEESGIQRDQLVIIDEASMVTKKMREDLQATNCKALFVGDPGQLPPVGDGGWFVQGEFGFVLETVQRQALDSPIVRMSMDVRNGRMRKSDYQFDNCRIVSKTQLTQADWLAADQVITGRNATRHRLNRYFRSKRGFSGELPEKGEKLICLKNDQIPTGEVEQVYFTNGVQCTSIANAEHDSEMDQSYISVKYEGVNIKNVPFYDYHCRSHYVNGMPEIGWFDRSDLKEFDYAYAITVHKSQGSEWDSVILADDKMNRRDREFRQRWLYTAITRAKEKLTWVQD